ncbi:MAG TPA: hypothetical protein VGQ83_14265 [Polyangia bacterium]|jgi:hypothetical protein
MTRGALMRVLFAFLFAALGCGGNNLAGADGGAPEDGAPEDGAAEDALVCSTPRVTAAPPPTHRALVAYDELVAGPDPTLLAGGFNEPVALFLDDQGVAFFGTNELLRLDLEGRLTTSSRNPRRPYDDAPVGVGNVVRASTGYGAIITYVAQDGLSYDTRFCLVTDDTWPALGACPQVPMVGGNLPVVAWDGRAFQVFGTSGVSTFDDHGAWVADHPFPAAVGNAPVLAAEFVGDKVMLEWFERDSKACFSDTVWVLPRSLDLGAVQKFDLTPSDFVVSNSQRTTAAGSSAAVLVYGVCFTRWPTPEVCYSQPQWPASFLTVVGPDGEPSLLRQPVPIRPANQGLADQLTWDGEHLVAVRATELFLEVYVLDLQGSMVRVALVGPELGLSAPRKHLGSARLVAVAPNDYIVGYGVMDSMETWIARFQLIPL